MMDKAEEKGCYLSTRFVPMAPEYYVFTGRDGEVIPDHIAHVLIAEGLKFVRARAFYEHPNVEEVICHDGVERIEEKAFYNCRQLRRVIMPGVKVVERKALELCKALTYIECGKLEIIGEWAFVGCKSLRRIDLPSIKIIEMSAFLCCTKLINVEFGKELESIRLGAFRSCKNLERIALPLKDGVMADDSIFQLCSELNHVDLIGGVNDTITALLVEEWKDDMNEEIDSISQILPNTPAGINKPFEYDNGGKARTIRTWTSSVLRKYTHYKSEHRRYLNEAAAALELVLPNDILFKNVLAFLELPSDTSFEEEE